jgi:crotonobetainyl-CoA:carnitine CoA-transferase CaiB-like acyl-CoA transferase
LREPGAGPLAGLKVIELAHVMAGPVCGPMPADLGADVIKVEKLPGGDDSRRSVPPELMDDPRFADHPGRMAHLDALAAALAPYLRARRTADWLTRLQAAGVPAGPP